MAYDLTGKVKVIMEARTFGSGFTVREFVVTVEEGKYPQDICLQCVQEKVSLLDTVQVGQEVTVTFDIRGRESKEGRYFNNLQAWRIEAKGGAVSGVDAPPVSDEEVPADLEEYEDEIPF